MQSGRLPHTRNSHAPSNQYSPWREHAELCLTCLSPLRSYHPNAISHPDSNPILLPGRRAVPPVHPLHLAPSSLCTYANITCLQAYTEPRSSVCLATEPCLAVFLFTTFEPQNHHLLINGIALPATKCLSSPCYHWQHLRLLLLDFMRLRALQQFETLLFPSISTSIPSPN